MPAGGGGVITDVLVSIGRISEYMFEGHWYTGAQIFDSLAKGTQRLNQNLYGGLTGSGVQACVVHHPQPVLQPHRHAIKKSNRVSANSLFVATILQ